MVSRVDFKNQNPIHTWRSDKSKKILIFLFLRSKKMSSINKDLFYLQHVSSKDIFLRKQGIQHLALLVSKFGH